MNGYRLRRKLILAKGGVTEALSEETSLTLLDTFTDEKGKPEVQAYCISVLQLTVH